MKIAAQGLSVRVEGMKGPVVKGELPKSTEFGSSIVPQVGETRNPAIKLINRKTGFLPLTARKASSFVGWVAWCAHNQSRTTNQSVSNVVDEYERQTVAQGSTR